MVPPLPPRCSSWQKNHTEGGGLMTPPLPSALLVVAEKLDLEGG
jgi:hypothetical protein